MRKSHPEVFRHCGEHVIRTVELADGKGWVGASLECYLWADAAGHVTSVPWSDIEGASWDDARNTLTLRCVDRTRGPLIHVLAPHVKTDLPLVVRERVQNSIVFQEHEVLPSGAKARGMVRRGRGETLFTQVIIDGYSSEADEDAVNSLEASLRDVTGISD